VGFFCLGFWVGPVVPGDVLMALPPSFSLSTTELEAFFKISLALHRFFLPMVIPFSLVGGGVSLYNSLPTASPVFF